jgi:hypothetical protein
MVCVDDPAQAADSTLNRIKVGAAIQLSRIVALAVS